MNIRQCRNAAAVLLVMLASVAGLRPRRSWRRPLMFFGRSKRLSAAAAAILFVLSETGTTQPPHQAPPLRAPLPLQMPVQDKMFYLLSLIERTPSVATVVKTDPGLAAIFQERLTAVKSAETECKGDVPRCTVRNALLTPEEIEAAGKRLEALYERDAGVRGLVAGPMRQCGLFELYRNEDDRTLLVHAWTDAAQGINRIINVYGNGAKPFYDKIDSASFNMNVSVPEYWTRLHGLVASLSDASLFFEPSLRFSLMLLALNHRDEAGRFEPMDRGENATTIAHIANVRWSDYPYTAILALGLGPEDPNIPISPGGKIVVAQVAKLFEQREAPLIIVSGGFVHPAQTRFSEAIEMRQLLIEQYGIPDNAILIDPHARHTTTNFRNADRLIYRYGIPMDRPALAEALSVAGILNDTFDQRNMKELGYLPYRDKMSISQSVMSFYPVVNGLQGDARDPLDP